MSLSARQLVVVLVTLALAASGTAGVAWAATPGASTEQASTAESPPTDASQQAPESNCAADPPADHDDPDSDVLGWENGTWYDESIEVDQSDGVDAAEQEALVDRTMARVEAVRCVEFTESVPVSVISRAEYREMERSGNLSATNLTEELRTFDNAKFEALFLINESADSIEVQRENRGSAVLGFYSPEEDEIFLIAEDRENLRIEETTLAHELMHAWQDQRYNLSSEELSPSVRDEVNARNGVVEGDASYVDRLYQQRCVDGDWNGTCLRPPANESGNVTLANIGVYFLKYQPYSDGPEFVRLVRTVGGWESVNELYERPPESSEQLIHVEKYRNDAPTSPNVTDETSENWRQVTPPDRPNYGSVGEAAVMSMFVYPSYDSGGQSSVLPPGSWFNFDEQGNTSAFDPYDYESNYSSGWDGDRLHVYENDANETAYVWRLAWDSPQDAREFLIGYQQVLDYWGAERVGPGTYVIEDGGFEDAFRVSVEGTNVTITNAPSVDQLDEVRPSAGNQTVGE